jgi:signal transduction histidine kinase
VSSVMAATVLLTVVATGWLLVLQHQQGRSRVTTAILVVILAALARGVVLESLVGSGQNMRYWLVSSCLTVSIAAVTGVLVKVSIDGHRLRLEDLAAEQQRLSLVLETADAELRFQRQDAVAEVMDVVAQQLAAVPESSPLLTMSSLEHVVADVVRPLSYELAAALPAWQPPEQQGVRRRLEWSRVWGSVADVGLIDPWGPALVALIAAPSSMLMIGFWQGLLLHFCLAAATLAGLTLIRSLAGTVGRARATAVRLVFAYILLSLACVPAAAIAFAFPGPSPGVIRGLWLVVVLPLVAMLLSVVRAARVQQHELEIAAVEVAEQTRWWISRTRMVGWWQRAMLARALHGPVQSAIHAAVQRLRHAEQSGTATPELIRSTMAQVRTALPAAVRPGAEAADVCARLDELAETWRPVADFSATLSPEDVEFLRQDPVCAEIAVDIIREATSNAVRHGGARAVHVSLRLADDRARVEVRDDGRGPAQALASTSAGLGTTMIEACALGWGYLSRDDGQLLWVELPRSPQDSGAMSLSVQTVSPSEAL